MGAEGKDDVDCIQPNGDIIVRGGGIPVHIKYLYSPITRNIKYNPHSGLPINKRGVSSL
jgi:hypothetical protein